MDRLGAPRLPTPRLKSVRNDDRGLWATVLFDIDVEHEIELRSIEEYVLLERHVSLPVNVVRDSGGNVRIVPL